MSKERNVVFRRFRGRIIPIKVNKQKLVEGGGYLGAGIGVGAIGGFSKALLSSREQSTGQAITNLKKVQREYFKKRGFSSSKMLSIGSKLRRRKAVFSKLKAFSGAKFSLAASTLIGLGTEKIASQFEGKKESIASEVLAGVTGGAVLLATRGKFAKKVVSKLHRFVSTKTKMTSKLNRSFVESRKGKGLNPDQLRFFLGKGK